MELAIAALNARLNAGPNDIFQWARRPQTADRVRGARARTLRVEQDFGRFRAKPASSVRLERKGRDALREVRAENPDRAKFRAKAVFPSSLRMKSPA